MKHGITASEIRDLVYGFPPLFRRHQVDAVAL
jgi:hypothetical protein